MRGRRHAALHLEPFKPTTICNIIMDQSELRQWEARCIQEEPPECTAACPLHLDVRAFIGHLREGRLKESWQILHRTLPLTRLLGRVCDAPCQGRCKRGEAGDAVQIGALERACLEQIEEDYRVTLLPPKGKKIAVVGGGWSSLTVAWDLIRKGFGVTLFDNGDPPGAVLVRRHAPIITESMAAEEMAVLQKWGVLFDTGADISSPPFFQQTAAAFDALYVGLEVVTPAQWPLDRPPDSRLKVDEKIQVTSHPKVFAGGDTSSVILQVSQGRWAATSIDRYLQKVSLTAGREKEGPYDTRLFTSLKGVTFKAATGMADPLKGYTPQEAQNEGERCLQCECLECVKACPYLEAFGAYPRKYAREIFNNESMFMGARTANKMINSCSLCGLCETVCPEDFAMQDLCLKTRRSMVENERMPPSAHEFALADMAFSQGEDFFLTRHAPGTDASAHLFFPGCQLCASSPHQVESLYAYLRQKISGGVGLMLGCCGAPAHWSGRREETDAVLAELKQHWQALASPTLILACASCHAMFSTLWPEAPTQPLWKTLEAVGLPEDSPKTTKGPLALHDPCTTRGVPAVQQSVRRLSGQLGLTISELPLSQNQTECCGFGGLMDNANPQIAQTVIQQRAAQSPHDYLTYCAMCRDRLAATGKRCLHLLDLIFPGGEEDPAGRPRPGWSERRDNRARLKARLLKVLWREPPPEPSNQERMALQISPKVQRLLDERRILKDDIREVIAHAESGGGKLKHRETGRLKASYRPRLVTFWVEYAPLPTGFEIFNAYAHRMEVKRS